MELIARELLRMISIVDFNHQHLTLDMNMRHRLRLQRLTSTGLLLDD